MRGCHPEIDLRRGSLNSTLIFVCSPSINDFLFDFIFSKALFLGLFHQNNKFFKAEKFVLLAIVVRNTLRSVRNFDFSVLI